MNHSTNHSTLNQHHTPTEENLMSTKIRRMFVLSFAIALVSALACATVPARAQGLDSAPPIAPVILVGDPIEADTTVADLPGAVGPEAVLATSTTNPVTDSISVAPVPGDLAAGIADPGDEGEAILATGCAAPQYTANYYNNPNLTGSPAYTRCEDFPSFKNWGLGAPVKGIGPDGFSVRWTGQQYLSAGNYYFSAYVNDGMRLWVGAVLVIDGWSDRSSVATLGQRVTIPLDGTYPVVVEYYDRTGDACVGVYWSSCVGTPIDIGYVGTGNVPGTGKYCLFAPTNQTASIRAAQVSGAIDTVVTVIPRNTYGLVLIQQNDDAKAYGSNSMLVVTLSTGYYEVRIGGHFRDWGRYRFHVGKGRKATVADVNSDGRVDGSDKVIVESFLGWPSTTDTMWNADINLDGVVDRADLEYVNSALRIPR
jgi:hypothetical protein